METEVEIVSYDEISPGLKSSLKTLDSYHSNYFWHECAQDWQEKLIHKVYTLVNTHRNTIYGFFSLRVNNIVANKEQIPILDIAFIDVSEKVSISSAKAIFLSFLEYIYILALELSKKVGCRYIRSYIPTTPSTENINSPGITNHYYLDEIYSRMNYFDPPFKEKEKIRKIRDKKLKNNKPILILKYLLRDLRIDI